MNSPFTPVRDGADLWMRSLAKLRLMSPTIEVLDIREIKRRRKALLVRAGMSVKKMRRMVEAYTLDQEHQAILRQIDELDFLAGVQPVDR